MASQQDFEILTKLRQDIANGIEMQRYQLEGIDLAFQALKDANAKPVAAAKPAAAATKPPPAPAADKPKTTAADKPKDAVEPPTDTPAATPPRARLVEVAAGS